MAQIKTGSQAENIKERRVWSYWCNAERHIGPELKSPNNSLAEIRMGRVLGGRRRRLSPDVSSAANFLGVADMPAAFFSRPNLDLGLMKLGCASPKHPMSSDRSVSGQPVTRGPARWKARPRVSLPRRVSRFARVSCKVRVGGCVYMSMRHRELCGGRPHTSARVCTKV